MMSIRNLAAAACILLSVFASSAFAKQTVFVFVHGVEANGQPDSNSYGNLQQGLEERFASSNVKPWFVRFDWGVESKWQATGRAGTRTFQVAGSSNRQWAAAAKLKEVLARLKYRFGDEISTTLVSHSQGTVVSMIALSEGAKVDHWITMGSVIGRDPIAHGSERIVIGEPSYRSAVQNVSGHAFNFSASSDYFVLGTAREIRDELVALISSENSPGRSIGRVGLPFVMHSKVDADELNSLPGRFFEVAAGEEESAKDPLNFAFAAALKRDGTPGDGGEFVLNIPIDVDRIPENERPQNFLWEHSVWWHKCWLSNGDAWPNNFRPDSFFELITPPVSQNQSPSLNDLKAIQSLAAQRIPSEIESEVTAVAPDDWRGFGEGASGQQITRRFTLTNGMRSGLHFDDARTASFSVKCLTSKSSVMCQLKVATWFTWNSELAVPQNPKMLSGEGAVWSAKYPLGDDNPPLLDKTFYLELTGVSDASEVEVTMTVNRPGPSTSLGIVSTQQATSILNITAESAAIDRFSGSSDDITRVEKLGDGLRNRHAANSKEWQSGGRVTKGFERDAFFENTRAIDGEPIRKKKEKAIDALEEPLNQVSKRGLRKPFQALGTNYYFTSLLAQNQQSSASRSIDEELLQMNSLRNRLSPYVLPRLNALAKLESVGNLSPGEIGGLLKIVPGDAYENLISDQRLASKLRLFGEYLYAADSQEREALNRVLATAKKADEAMAVLEARSSLERFRESLLATSDSSDDANLSWVQANRDAARRCVEIIDQAVEIAIPESSTRIAIDRYSNGSIRLPASAYAAGRPHLRMQFGDAGKAIGANSVLQARIFLCLPSMYEVRHMTSREAQTPEGTPDFEEVDLGITIDGLRISPRVWRTLGKVIELQTRYQNAGLSLEQILVPNDNMTIAPENLTNLESAFEFLSQQFDSTLCSIERPAGNAQYGIGQESKQRIRDAFSSWGVPEWLLGGLWSFELDRETFQWVEFGFALRVPFAEETVMVPVRLQLADRRLDESNTRDSFRNELLRVVISKINNHPNVSSGGSTQLGPLELRYRNFKFSHSKDDGEIHLSGDLAISKRGTPGTRSAEPEFGSWKLLGRLRGPQVNVGNRDTRLVALPIPGLGYSLELEAAAIADGTSIKPHRWLTQKRFTDLSKKINANQVKPGSSAEPSESEIETFLEYAKDGLRKLELENLSLESGISGIEIVGTISAGRNGKPRGRSPFRSNLKDIDGQIAKIFVALGEKLLRSELAYWAASQVKIEDSLTEQLANTLKKLKGAPLRQGPVRLVFGDVEVLPHEGYAADGTPDAERNAVRVSSLAILVDAPVNTEIRIDDLQLLIGDDDKAKNEATKILESVAEDGTLTPESVAKLLSAFASLMVDTSIATIAVDGDFRSSAKNLIPAVTTTLDQPEFIQAGADSQGAVRTIGVGFAAALKIDETISDALSLTLPRVRLRIEFSGEVKIEVEETTGSWKSIAAIDAGSVFETVIRQTIMSSVADAMSRSVENERVELFGLGAWQFNSKTDERPAVGFKADGGSQEFLLRGKFVAEDDLKIPAEVSLPDLKVKFTSEGFDLKSLVEQYLSNLCGAGIEVKNIQETRKPIGVTFDVKGNLESLGSFQMQGVQVTTRRILLPESITVRTGAPLPVATGLWLCDAGITVPLNGDIKIGVVGDFALIEASTKRLLKIATEAAVEIPKDSPPRLIATATARTVLVTVLPVMESRGEMILGDGVGSIELESKTVGPMSKLVNFRNHLSVRTEIGELSADGNLEILGFTIGEGNLLIVVKPSAVTVDLSGEVNVLTMKSSVKARYGSGLGLEEAVFTSMQGLALGKIAGSDINLGSVRIEATTSTSLIKFGILDTSLSLRGPPIQTITVNWLKKEVERFLRQGLLDIFDPEKVAKAIEQIAKGNVTIEPGGTLGGGGNGGGGNGGDGNGGDGNGGDGNGGGGNGGGGNGDGGNGGGGNGGGGNGGGGNKEVPGEGDGTGSKPGTPRDIPTIQPEPGELLIATVPQHSYRVVKHDGIGNELRWVSRGHNFKVYVRKEYPYVTDDHLQAIKNRKILAVDGGSRSDVLLLGPKDGDFGALLAVGYHWESENQSSEFELLKADDLKAKRTGLPQALRPETVVTGLFPGNSIQPVPRGQQFSELEAAVVRKIIHEGTHAVLERAPGNVRHEPPKESEYKTVNFWGRSWRIFKNPSKRSNYIRPDWSKGPTESKTELLSITESNYVGKLDAIVQARTQVKGIPRIELRRWSDDYVFLSIPAVERSGNSLSETLSGGVASDALIEFVLSTKNAENKTKEISLFANATQNTADLKQYLFATVPKSDNPIEISRLDGKDNRRTVLLHHSRLKPRSKRSARNLFSTELASSAPELRNVVQSAVALDATDHKTVDVFPGRVVQGKSVAHQFAIVTSNLDDDSKWKAVLVEIRDGDDPEPADTTAVNARLIAGTGIVTQFKEWVGQGLVTNASFVSNDSLPVETRRKLISIVTAPNPDSWRQHFKVDPQGLFLPQEKPSD